MLKYRSTLVVRGWVSVFDEVAPQEVLKLFRKLHRKLGALIVFYGTHQMSSYP